MKCTNCSSEDAVVELSFDRWLCGSCDADRCEYLNELEHDRKMQEVYYG